MPKKVLVIDDEPMVIKMATDALVARGFEVSSAPNGYEGLIAAHQLRPDLILLDVVMPDLDGHEVARRLGKDERTKDIPIIHLSAIGDFDQQLAAMDGGLTDYITSPSSPPTWRTASRRSSIPRSARRPAATRTSGRASCARSSTSCTATTTPRAWGRVAVAHVRRRQYIWMW